MTNPRIQLVHAVPAARDPIQAAFGRLWPDARIVEFTDDTLAADLEKAGSLTDAFTGRMAGLIDRGVKDGAHAVLFTSPVDDKSASRYTMVVPPDREPQVIEA